MRCLALKGWRTSYRIFNACVFVLMYLPSCHYTSSSFNVLAIDWALTSAHWGSFSVKTGSSLLSVFIGVAINQLYKSLIALARLFITSIVSSSVSLSVRQLFYLVSGLISTVIDYIISQLCQPVSDLAICQPCSQLDSLSVSTNLISFFLISHTVSQLVDFHCSFSH